MNHTANKGTKEARLFPIIPLAVIFVLLIYKGSVLADAAYESLAFAATKLIPSMFLFAVFTKIASGIAFPDTRRKIPLLRLPASAAPSLLIGLLSGFPMGAYAAKSLVDHGMLDEKQAIHLACFANNASLGFLVFTVGELFHAPRVGWLLFLSGTLASLIIGILFAPKPSQDTLALTREPPKAFFTLFCESITSATNAMLTLAGYLTLFGTLAEAIVMTHLPAPFITAFLLLLEPTAAVRHLATLPQEIALPLAAFALGFSGLSILMQSMTVWQNRLPLSRLVAMRAMIGLLSAFFILTFEKIL